MYNNTPQMVDGNIGPYLPTAGGTMTGELKSSWHNSWGHFVVNGSGQAQANTVPTLVDELRYSSGATGSASIATAYVSNSITISPGWYNFAYIPHRSGGLDGNTQGDNQNYGQLILIGMTVTRGQTYIISVSGGEIITVKRMVSQWIEVHTGNLSQSSSNTTVSLSGYDYKEILIEVGQTNGEQIYGGTSVVVPKDSNHPMFIYFATGGATLYKFYAFQDGNSLLVRNVDFPSNLTVRYRVYVR